MAAWMLEADYLEYIHDSLVVLLWPEMDPVGDHEQRDRPMIESAAARPFHSAFEKDAYPTVLEKAVALFHSINANHAFMNGNKRTAVIALDHFLMANNHCLLLDNGEMYKIAEKTASYKKRGLSQDQSLAEITEALEEQVISIDIVEQAVGQQEHFLKIIGRFKKVRDAIRTSRFVSLRG